MMEVSCLLSRGTWEGVLGGGWGGVERPETQVEGGEQGGLLRVDPRSVLRGCSMSGALLICCW